MRGHRRIHLKRTALRHGIAAIAILAAAAAAMTLLESGAEGAAGRGLTRTSADSRPSPAATAVAPGSR
jgi:hypothetical protein